jgi:hypothetical protein
MRHRTLRGCLVAGLLAVSPVSAQSKSNRPIPDPRELPTPDKIEASCDTPSPANDKRGTEEVPFSVKILPGEKSKSETAKEEYEANEKPGLDRWLTTYTGWLAIFTAALFAAAGIQVGLFWWQLRLIRDEAKETAAAAKISAIQADAQMKETRAYIFTNSAKITNYGASEIVRAELFLRNTGKTPAHTVRFKGKIGVDYFPSNEFPPLAKVKQMGTMGQGQEMIQHCTMHIALSKEQFDSIESGKAAVYLFGEVTYVDVYGINCWTKFHLYYGGDIASTSKLVVANKNGGDNLSTSRAMAVYGTGNEIGCDK